MARKITSTTTPHSAVLTLVQAREAIPRLQRRLEELKSLDVNALSEQDGSDVLAGYATKVNSTLRSIFGDDSIEYYENHVPSFEPHQYVIMSDTDRSIRGNLAEIRANVASCVARLTTTVELLRERVGYLDTGGSGHIIKAYEGLELHPEIARAASKLYRDGHYANAVEGAVKALNGLVRLRSTLEQDGTTLMERAFSASNPVLRFNALADQSDRDEQKGFMMLFSGAVAGLRNPRAHGFIEDDPERALEFIAFVSLLAKLLDGATT